MKRILLVTLLLWPVPAMADTITLPYTSAGVELHSFGSSWGTAHVEAPGFSGTLSDGFTFSSLLDPDTVFASGFPNGYTYADVTYNGISYSTPLSFSDPRGPYTAYGGLSWTSPGVMLDPNAANGTVFTYAIPVHLVFNFSLILADGTFQGVVLPGDVLYTVTFTAQKFCDTDTGFCSPTNYLWFEDGSAAVPEPATWMLLGSGLIGMLLWRKRTA